MTRRSIGNLLLVRIRNADSTREKEVHQPAVTKTEAELEAEAEADLKALRVQTLHDDLAVALSVRRAAVAIRPVDEVAFREVVYDAATYHKQRPGLRLAQVGAELHAELVELSGDVGAVDGEGHLRRCTPETKADPNVGM